MIHKFGIEISSPPPLPPQPPQNITPNYDSVNQLITIRVKWGQCSTCEKRGLLERGASLISMTGALGYTLQRQSTDAVHAL